VTTRTPSSHGYGWSRIGLPRARTGDGGRPLIAHTVSAAAPRPWPGRGVGRVPARGECEVAALLIAYMPPACMRYNPVARRNNVTPLPVRHEQPTTTVRPLAHQPPDGRRRRCLVLSSHFILHSHTDPLRRHSITQIKIVTSL